MFLLGYPAFYPMENGERSVGLVAGLPISYIEQILALDNEDSLVHCHIIRRNGGGGSVMVTGSP